jgi:hypothetical protein
VRTTDQVAEHYAGAKAGFRLLRCEDAALPMYWLTLDALVQERKRIPALEEYVLRSIAAGMDTVPSIAGMLGVEEPLVERAVSLLWEYDYLDYPSFGQFGRSLQLTRQGRENLDELTLQSPQRREVWIAWDRILWRPLMMRRAVLMPPREVKEAEVLEIKPARQKRPDVADLDLDTIDKLLKQATGIAGESLDLLSITRVLRAERMFLPAHLLVYQSTDGRECEVGVAIDGRRSEEHDDAIAALGGAAFLAITVDVPARDGIDLTALPANEVERVRSAAVPLAEVERIRTETANARWRLAALDIQDSADEDGPRSLNAGAIEAEVEERRLALEALPVREIDTFEHAILFDQYRQTTRHRLLIVAPWISGKVVTKRFLDDLRRLARKGVTIRIGYGIDDERAADERDRLAERELLRLAKEPNDVVVARLGDTHAKVLISDDTVIVGSFNWLSFKGDQRRLYRQERGMLVQIKETVDASYEEHRARIEAAAT